MADNRKKFSKIYNKHIDKLYRFVFLKVSSTEIAEDVTAQVFTKGWRKFKSGAKIDNVSAYLFQIARAEIANHYRQSAKYKIISTAAVEVIEEGPTIEEEQQKKGQVEDMEQYLGQLKDEYQDVLILRYIDGYSIGEIALMMDKKEGTVRVLMHRALQALREKMDGKV